MTIVLCSAARFWKTRGKNHKGQLEMTVTGMSREEEKPEGKKEVNFSTHTYTHTHSLTPLTSFFQSDFFLICTYRAKLCSPMIIHNNKKFLYRKFLL